MRSMTTIELVAEFRTLAAVRQELVKAVGMGRATVEQLKEYNQLRKDMQRYYMELIRRGYTAAELYQ